MAKIEIEESELRFLIDKAKEQDADLKKLYQAGLGAMSVFGLAKNGKILIDLFKGNKALKTALKSGVGLFTTAVSASMPGIGKDAEDEIANKFSFLNETLPVFLKYEEIYNKKQLASAEQKQLPPAEQKN